ncbi:MAG: hypothetical protein H0U79_03615 [Solirubrobacterales bacterium]|nr:hypothetical protein [Solirubrobacterales bacterium]
MAQTRRKRRTKHRGNAAGMIETKGRTGRPAQSASGKGGARDAARSKAVDRFSKPPSWRSAMNRAGIAAVFFGVVMVLLFDRSIAQALPLAGFMLVLYVPLGYYTDLVMFRRRQRGPKRPKRQKP